MVQVLGRVDQRDGFFLTQHNRQAARPFRILHFFERIRTLQRLDEEEPQRGRVVGCRAHADPALFDQVRLIVPDLVRPHLIRRLAEVLGEAGHRPQIGPCCSLRIITTLEFLQHHLA